jgi:cytochrome c553
MKIRLQRLVVLLAVAAVWLVFRPQSAMLQAPEPSPEQIEFFEKKIRPILVANCFSCHSPQSQKLRGGLWLDSREAVLRGGASGTPAITPGDPEKSLLVKGDPLRDSKLQMPPGGKLSDQEIADLETWIKRGAAMPVSIASVTPPAAYDFEGGEEVLGPFDHSKHSTPAVGSRSCVGEKPDRPVRSRKARRKEAASRRGC